MSKRDKFWTGLGILLFFLVNYPLLQIFNRDTLVRGIPFLFWYLFLVWVLAIVGLYFLARRHLKRKESG